MQTAIIGLGNIGKRPIAARLTAGGIDVIVSERHLDKARQLAAKRKRCSMALGVLR